MDLTAFRRYVRSACFIITHCTIFYDISFTYPQTKTDGRTGGRTKRRTVETTDGWMDGHDLLKRWEVTSKNREFFASCPVFWGMGRSG